MRTGPSVLPSPSHWKFKYVENPPGLIVDRHIEVLVASPLEIVYDAWLVRRITAFLDVLGETERQELTELVRQQLSLIHI